MDDAPSATRFAYDAVAYPAPILPALSPERLKASGLLRGWETADPMTASVLEIACGDGLNLIGAASVAKGHHVGFDLSAEAIARGRELVAEAGLSNVELEEGDILTYPRHGEQFDYIICHGVLSWIPMPVRDALIELIGARLAPGGVAYVSFDSLPAAAPKAFINAFLRQHTAGIPGVEDQIKEAIRLISILDRNQQVGSRLQAQLDILREDMPKFDAGYFYHDWLAEHYAPVDLMALAESARGHGLKIAGAAGLGDLFTENMDADTKAIYASLGDDHVARTNFLGLIHGIHIFNRELIVRADAPPPPIADALEKLRFAFIGKREEITDEKGEPAVKYYDQHGGYMTSQHELTVTVMDRLFAAAPREYTFAELIEETSVAPSGLEQLIRKGVMMGVVEPHSTPPQYVLTPGERPRTSKLLRAMLARGERAINQRGAGVVAEQNETRYCLALCDGTRTHADIAATMSEYFKEEATAGNVAAAVDHFAGQRVFEA
jgi:SAM-dependent methyltransferase